MADDKQNNLDYDGNAWVLRCTQPSVPDNPGGTTAESPGSTNVEGKGTSAAFKAGYENDLGLEYPWDPYARL